MTAIADNAFEDNTQLTEINLPGTVEKIGIEAFKGCTSLASFTGKFASTDHRCLIVDNELIAFAPANLTTYEIPDVVTKIGVSAFEGCSALTSFTIPTNVTEIGADAFKGCTSLATINVGETPATLGTDAFSDINENHVVNVPLNSYTSYNQLDGWKALNLTPQAGTIALKDAAGYEIDKNVAGCTLSYTRKVTSDNWMGVYLPFDVDVTKVSGTYAMLKSVSEGYLNWETKESGTIPACTPFIYKPTEFETGEESRNITFKVTEATLHSCEEANPVTPATGYKLDGTFKTKTDMASTHAYALASGNFYYTNDPTKTLKPYRIFLTVPFSNNAPVRNRINGEDVTAIEGIYADEADGSWQMTNGTYNLSGQKVGKDYNGFVIINGKKVLKK